MRRSALPIMIHPAVPRALIGPVMATATPRAMVRAAGLAAERMSEADAAGAIRELTAGLDGFRSEFAGRLDAIEAHQRETDEQETREATRRAGIMLNGEGGDLTAALPVDREYSKPFASYVRRGSSEAEETLKAANAVGDRAQIQAAMSVGDNSSGGYIAPVEWDRQIQKSLRALSPMRRLAQVVTTARSAYSTLWSDDQFGSGWTGETASRPATTTNQFSPLVIPAGEIYAMPAVTQRLLDDSAVDLEQWLTNNLSDEFARQEAIAFVSGDGVNKPMGFLRNVVGGTAETAHPGGPLGQTVSGHATLINNADTFVDLKYGLAAPYRQNATWLMNSQTAAVIAKMKDGQGNFIWREALLASEPATLLGRPVEIDENMPNIGAGTFPIAFGDFSRGYLVNDRIGVRVLRDPYTNKPFVMFYATKRVGGAVLDPRAIRVMKVAAS